MKNNLLPKRILEIKDGSFELKTDGDVQEAPKVIYSFSKIIYCGVDGQRRKVFVFNYHHGSGDGREVYLTHAFMCETKTVAKKLAMAVAKVFSKCKISQYAGGTCQCTQCGRKLTTEKENFGFRKKK